MSFIDQLRETTPEVSEATREEIKHQNVDGQPGNVVADPSPVNATLPDALSLAEELQQVILRATTWANLETALERAQAAYQAGELDAEEVEGLARIAQQEAQTLPENAEELRLSHLFDENPIRRVYSRVLGDTVILAADGVELPADLEGVVYRASELRQIPGWSPEQVKKIHTTKKEVDGEVVQIPRGAGGEAEGQRIPAEVLIDAETPDICRCCGRVNWWTKPSGQRVCGVCHPEPRPSPNGELGRIRITFDAARATFKDNQ